MSREKTRDVTALGELLIDFTENGLSGQGNPLFEANPGGAPCNVLSMLSGLPSKLSRDTPSSGSTNTIRPTSRSGKAYRKNSSPRTMVPFRSVRRM